MLEGKIALVTGASRGIGREIALELARNKAIVIVNYRGSKQLAQQVVEEITEMGQQAIAYCADISNVQEATEMMDMIIKRYNRLDILVNNAGITRDNLIIKMSEEEFSSVLNTNLIGTFHCLKLASKQMLKQKYGRIVNISSVVGVIGNAGQANYCAAKAGVIGMTKSLARELGSRQITVNAVAPGFIETDMTQGLSDQVKDAARAQIPLKRMGKAEEVAHAVTFLASDQASYITGQVLQVDGGMGM